MRRNSIWQLDKAAMKASSGSTFAATAWGTGTMCGEADVDAAIWAQPSNTQSWARL